MSDIVLSFVIERSWFKNVKEENEFMGFLKEMKKEAEELCGFAEQELFLYKRTKKNIFINISEYAPFLSDVIDKIGDIDIPDIEEQIKQDYQ